MARTIQKPGMFCEQCDRPIAAQKNKHGVRNTVTVLTLVPVGKIEGWHCPTCGGPAITVQEHERNLQHGGRAPSFLEQIRGPAADAEPGDYMVRITALPKSNKPPTAWGNLGAVGALTRALGLKTADVQARLAELPFLTTGMTEPRAKGIVLEFQRLGGAAEVTCSSAPPPGAALPPPVSQPPPPPGPPPPGSEDPLHLLRQLAELRDAGVISEQDFESKKRDLLAQL